MDKKSTLIEVFVAMNHEDWKGEPFNLNSHPSFDWGGGTRRAILSRLGEVLSAIKLPFPVKVVLGGVKHLHLRVALTSVGDTSVSDEGEVLIDLFEDAYNRFYDASDNGVKWEFLRCLKRACCESCTRLFEEMMDLRSQAGRKEARGLALDQLVEEGLSGCGL